MVSPGGSPTVKLITSYSVEYDLKCYRLTTWIFMVGPVLLYQVRCRTDWVKCTTWKQGFSIPHFLLLKIRKDTDITILVMCPGGCRRIYGVDDHSAVHIYYRIH